MSPLSLDVVGIGEGRRLQADQTLAEGVIMNDIAAVVPFGRIARRLLRGSKLAERLVSLAGSKTSYSQFGEDIHVSSYYARLVDAKKITVKNGYFVDIGAFRPMVRSNSYFFYKQHWHGINIDPTPGFKRSFDKLRPGDLNLEIGIAPEAGPATFFLFGRPSVWNTLDAKSAETASEATGTIPQNVSVNLERLDSVLDRHLNGASLELLLIDAEGYDMEILLSNDFRRFRPRVILIEVMDITAETLVSSPVIKYLCNFGYQLHSWINPNLMLVREDSLVF
jgi:FkbM family methyltransferase